MTTTEERVAALASRRTRPAPAPNGTTPAKKPRTRDLDIPEPTVVTAEDTPALARQAQMDRIDGRLRELKSNEYLSFSNSDRNKAERLRTRLQTAMRSRGLTLATQIEEDQGKHVLFVRLRESKQLVASPVDLPTPVPDAAPVETLPQSPPPDA